MGSERTGSNQLGKPRKTAVIGSFHFVRKATRRQLAQLEVIVQAFAAQAVAGTTRVAAVATSRVPLLFAFHAPIPTPWSWQTKGASSGGIAARRNLQVDSLVAAARFAEGRWGMRAESRAPGGWLRCLSERALKQARPFRRG